MLRLIVRLFGTEQEQFYNMICRCYFYLDDTKPISDILWSLINRDSSTDRHHSKELMAYQIAFDLNEYQNDAFLRGIFNHIARPPASQLLADKPTTSASTDSAAADASSSGNEAMAADIGATALSMDAEEEAAASHWDDDLEPPRVGPHKMNSFRK